MRIWLTCLFQFMLGLSVGMAEPTGTDPTDGALEKAQGPPMTSNELMAALSTGHSVRNRVIQGAFLAEALRKLEPTSAEDEARFPDMEIEDCVIKYPFWLTDIVRVSVSIKRTIFEGSVRLGGDWKRGFNAESCLFKEWARFEGSIPRARGRSKNESGFWGIGLVLNGSRFESYLRVGNCGLLGLTGCYVKGDALISGNIDGRLQGDKCQILGRFEVTGTISDGGQFNEATFNNEANFASCIVATDGLTFRNTNFDKSIRFSGIRMLNEGALKLTQCQIKGDAGGWRQKNSEDWSED